MIFFGDDFKYKENGKEFNSLDQIMIFMESNPSYFRNFKLKYSLPRDYFSSIRAEGKKMDPIPREDFMPLKQRKDLTNNKDGAWTGFYSSRFWFKGLFQGYQRFVELLKSSLCKGIFKS